ncbi:phenylacetate--CoA ligase family protein [Hippea alviniae]|uniref:phenylacetate--CoA ligase family protein n=1 Tax=Hippea alviniae TaxID=1279027 RepID=UPI0003B62D72|nr:phenylacetate--CoA ligase [Hippea alviniae]
MIFNREMETLPREEIEKLQLERLKETIKKIKNSSSIFKEKYRDIEPDDIKSLDDLKKIPLLEKDEIRRAYPFRHIAVEDDEKWMRMHMSSGTTGTPVINVMTKHDIQQWGEIMARCYYAAGVTAKDRIQITPSFGLFNGGFGFHYGAEKIGAFIIPVGAGRSRLQLKFMEDLGTTVMTGIASYPLRLIEVAHEIGFDFKKTNLRVAILGAETWSDEIRARIEEEMGVDTYDIIGMTETGGVGLGIDCEVKNGIHVWEDHYIVEIIDPSTGEVLEDGKEGEMVITTLTREGMALLRYRTRDITRIISRDRCDCGRTHLRVDRLKGRTDDMLKVKGVNFYPSQIENILMRYKQLSPYYHIVIEKVKGKGHMTIVAERKNGFSVDLNRLHAELYDFLGFKVDIQIVPEGTLERPQGKAIRVIDKRQK